jgi:MFS transporter, ACS family, allantoate permease
MSDVDTKERYEDDSSKDVTMHPNVAVSVVDTAAALVSGNESELDPEEALRIRRKIDKHLLPLMCSACAGCVLSSRHLDFNIV